MSNVTDELMRVIRSKIRLPGRIQDVNPFDLTITSRPSNKEDVLVTKNADSVVYDFSKATDEAKTALALSYQVIKSALDTMPEQIKDFYTQAQEELGLDAIIKSAQDEAEKVKGKGADADADDDKDNGKESAALIEVVKSALPGVFETVVEKTTAPLLAEIKKSQDRIDELEGQRAKDELREIARTLMTDDGPPSAEFITQLSLIQKSMTPDQFKTYLESQRSQIAMIQKSALFERASHPAATAPGSAYEELEVIAKSILEKSVVKDFSAAWETAIHQNPGLYARYQSEQAKVAASA